MPSGKISVQIQQEASSSKRALKQNERTAEETESSINASNGQQSKYAGGKQLPRRMLRKG
ncbi:hypothetical protein BC567DRAFT_228637 [Phyllosticta citribraziliensis]